MAIFGPKPWVNPFGKMSIFPLLELVLFIAQKDVFSFQNIVKDVFRACIAQKKNLEKWPFLDQNHGLTPQEKCQFFDFLNFLFLQPRMAFFSFSNIVKDIFLAYIAYNKKDGKMVIFRSKPWVNSFGKMSIFRLFELLVCIAQKGFFSFQNIVTDICLDYIA